MKSTEAYVHCSDFLGTLFEIGLRQENLTSIEAAYWSLLIDRWPSTWDNTTPFREPHAQADLVKCSAALSKFMAGSEWELERVSDAFFSFVTLAEGSVRRPGIDEEIRRSLRRESLGQYLRCAAFVALAMGFGVYQEKQAELEVLVAQEVTR